MPRRKHVCYLDLGSDSMLPIWTSFLGQQCRMLRKLGQLTKHHPETLKYYRSYSTVVAERQRLLLEDGVNVIHPLSLFSLFWMSLMVIVNISHMFLSTFRLFFIIDPMDNLKIHWLDHVLLGLYAICLVDIGIKFNTGYVVNPNSHVVMSRKSILCHYLSRWFIVDLASSLPVAYVMLSLKFTARYILVAHILSTLRVARIYTVAVDSRISMRVFTESYIVHGLVRLAGLFVLSVHWCTCLMYLPAILFYYWTGEMPTKFNYYMRIQDNENSMVSEIATRYNKAIIISVSAFFGTGFTMFRSTETDEILIHSIVFVYAAFFIIFTIVFVIKSYLTIYASTMRYQCLMNQVEEYMKYRQFPLSLKKRVRAFYLYRYQERYFKEEADLECLSDGTTKNEMRDFIMSTKEQVFNDVSVINAVKTRSDHRMVREELRDEIKLHTCRTLVHKVKLFEDVSASVVGTVLGCLRPVVYLSNDLVVRAGDIGDCMYFIATGTVAVYSLKGVEVCHLEDGNHFGEVALLMKDSKRVATVVAVENTQLYRLEALDFNRFVMSHSTLYNRIEELASRRMHETVLLDDKFRRDREEQHGRNSTSIPQQAQK